MIAPFSIYSFAIHHFYLFQLFYVTHDANGVIHAAAPFVTY